MVPEKKCFFETLLFFTPFQSLQFLFFLESLLLRLLLRSINMSRRRGGQILYLAFLFLLLFSFSCFSLSLVVLKLRSHLSYLLFLKPLLTLFSRLVLLLGLVRSVCRFPRKIRFDHLADNGSWRQ